MAPLLHRAAITRLMDEVSWRIVTTRDDDMADIVRCSEVD